MKVEFFGVRGSVPSPGPETQLYGGNTSCVSVQSKTGTRVILDSGTGIIKLGDILLRQTSDINILLTHNHWDHIQGFPFFKPIYQANRVINIYPGQVDTDDKDAILKQMSGSYFPVKYNELPSNINLDTERTKASSFFIGDILIRTKPLNHPDGGSAYVLEVDGKKIAYVTDNELVPPGKQKTSFSQWISFVEDADVLIHDGQYVDEELDEKSGWGHSSVNHVARLAKNGKVKQLVLISHDPTRTDTQLQLIETSLQSEHHDVVQIDCGKEGTIIEL